VILMIDNYDSFTYNVVQYCLELGADLKVVRNDEITVRQIRELNPEKIIISPGPATPDEAGVSLEVIDEFKDSKPIFGICLGHQSIAQAFGAEITRAKNMMHGKTSQIEVERETPLFKDLPTEFRATRYHSLIVNPKTITDEIIITSYSRDDREIMSLEIKNRPIFGVQFHPESIMSEYGHNIIGNFLNL